MFYAIKNGKKITAKRKTIATCPICKKKLIPKCGLIKLWHWSHKSNVGCDDWCEPESIWHKQWKDNFKRKYQEVVVGKHIADIKIKNLVIELQNSPISPKEIEDREIFYGNMIWILNGESIAKGLNLRCKGNYYTFRWKHPPKSWWSSTKPIYIDIKEFDRGGGDIFGKLKSEEYIFLIKKIYTNIPCGGWGILIKKEDFIKQLKKGENYGNY